MFINNVHKVINHFKRAVLISTCVLLFSLLRSVVERLESCHCQREQLQSRLEQVKQQIAALPHHFPWPGHGDRRHTVDQARSLLDRTRALTPSLSALRALGREMSQLTRDSSWIDPSWVTMEECIPELINELTVRLKGLNAPKN